MQLWHILEDKEDSHYNQRAISYEDFAACTVSLLKIFRSILTTVMQTSAQYISNKDLSPKNF